MRLTYEGEEVRLEEYVGGLPLCTELLSSGLRFREKYLRMVMIDKDQGWAPDAEQEILEKKGHRYIIDVRGKGQDFDDHSFQVVTP